LLNPKINEEAIMPKVGKKTYPYTQAGMTAAAKAKKKNKKKRGR